MAGLIEKVTVFITRQTVFTDNHILFWASMTELPSIISPQDAWLGMWVDQLHL
jgi:hypothetical protein